MMMIFSTFGQCARISGDRHLSLVFDDGGNQNLDAVIELNFRIAECLLREILPNGRLKRIG